MILAVDFDGTLCMSDYPNIGNPNMELIEALKRRQSCGDQLILWTCRAEHFLDEAVEWCKSHGLHFDAVNDNVPETVELWGHNSRKITADIYIDDRSEKPWTVLLEKVV